MKKFVPFLTGLVCACACLANSVPPLVPMVRSYQARAGFFELKEKELSRACVQEVREDSVPSEGYRLSITPTGVRVFSSDEAGAFYAFQTLKQLVQEQDKGLRLACAEIGDAPQFKWRGFMLDEGRHFFGKEVVKRTLDLMAQHKLNVFHWHLTEDQGWRLEIPKYPELVKFGAVRPSSPRHWGKRKTLPPGYIHQVEQTTEPYGPYYYTAEDVKEILAYAQARFIQVVPEIEFPGHVCAALAAYPELACYPAHFASRSPFLMLGISEDVLCAGNPKSLQFVYDVLDYVCTLFPSDVIHIGGDECPVSAWKTCARCQAFMKANGLQSEKEIQNWFTRQVVDYLAKKNRRTIGWDEYLIGDVPTQAMGMSWRTKAAHGKNVVTGAEAAHKGHDMVMASSAYCYVSRPQGLPEDPFEYYGKAPMPLQVVYQFDPYDGVSDTARAHVVGGHICAWTECTWNIYDLEWKMWPRTCALAEILWLNPPLPRDFTAFEKRLAIHRRNLIRQGVNVAPLR